MNDQEKQDFQIRLLQHDIKKGEEGKKWLKGAFVTISIFIVVHVGMGLMWIGRTESLLTGLREDFKDMKTEVKSQVHQSDIEMLRSWINENTRRITRIEDKQSSTRPNE